MTVSSARKAEPLNMVACQLCAKPFGKPTKLQRHLLQAHPVDVTIARDGRATSPGGPALNEEQLRADEGVRAALAAANLAMQISNTGSGVDCPQCLPDKRGKIFKNAIDLASHMIIKHNIIPRDDDSDDDEESVQQGLDLFSVAARQHLIADAEVATRRAAETCPALAASEISEKFASRKRTLPDISSAGADGAKRTKLLCVDVSNDGAKAPIPREAVHPIPSLIPKPELKVCSTSVGSLEPGSTSDKGADLASAEKPPGLARVTPEESTHGNRVVKEELNDAGALRGETNLPTRAEEAMQEKEKATTATSKKPPVTPKTAESYRESVLSAVDTVALEILAAKQAAMRSVKGVTRPTLQTEALPSLIPVTGNPLASRAKFMTVGFDMDFTDICDFPSSVHRAYYRQAGTVQNGSAKP
jgi:hypothetical protein